MDDNCARLITCFIKSITIMYLGSRLIAMSRVFNLILSAECVIVDVADPACRAKWVQVYTLRRHWRLSVTYVCHRYLSYIHGRSKKKSITALIVFD